MSKPVETNDWASHTENPGQEEEGRDPKKPWILHTLAK